MAKTSMRKPAEAAAAAEAAGATSGATTDGVTAEKALPAMSVVLLVDGPEGKTGEIARAVAHDRAEELITAKRARPATLADFGFAQKG